MEERVEPVINNNTESQLMGVIAAIFAVIITISKCNRRFKGRLDFLTYFIIEWYNISNSTCMY